MVAENTDVKAFEEAIEEEIKLRQLLNKDEDEEIDIELPLQEREVWINMDRIEMFDESDNGEQTLLLLGDSDIVVNMSIDKFLKVIEKYGY